MTLRNRDSTNKAIWNLKCIAVREYLQYISNNIVNVFKMPVNNTLGTSNNDNM